MELRKEDILYLDKKEAKSAIFFGHDKEAESIEKYREYITSIKFLELLKVALEYNQKHEFLDDIIKKNILNMLTYVRYNTTGFTPILNECITLINSTPNTRGVNNFYKNEYIKRHPDLFPTSLIKLFKKYVTDWSRDEKLDINRSIGNDFGIIQTILFEEEQTFINEDALYFLHEKYFIDTLNVVLYENPYMFKYNDFKDKALFILSENINTYYNNSNIYTLSIPESEKDKLIIPRSKQTIKKILKL